MTKYPAGDTLKWFEPFTQPQNLDVLCREPDIQNIEIFKPNHYYGNAAVLKHYAGLPMERPVKGIIQHGIYLYPGDFTAGGELEALLPMFLPISPARAEIYHRLSGGKLAVPIGSSFLYAKALLEDPLPPVEKRGTIVFLSHSTRQVVKVFDHAAYAEELAALPEKFHPITISAYWKDYRDGQYAPYAAKGFELVTAGHMMDPDFLYRFYVNCRRFRYACSNDVGTHLFFAVESGCVFFILAGGKIRWESNKTQHLEGQAVHEALSEDICKFFAEPLEETTPQQQAFVDEHMGKASFKSPKEIRELLLKAERMDKFQGMPVSGSIDGKFPAWYRGLPTYWQRKRLLTKLAGACGRMANASCQ